MLKKYINKKIYSIHINVNKCHYKQQWYSNQNDWEKKIIDWSWNTNSLLSWSRNEYNFLIVVGVKRLRMAIET